MIRGWVTRPCCPNNPRCTWVHLHWGELGLLRHIKTCRTQAEADGYRVAHPEGPAPYEARRKNA